VTQRTLQQPRDSVKDGATVREAMPFDLIGTMRPDTINFTPVVPLTGAMVPLDAEILIVGTDTPNLRAAEECLRRGGCRVASVTLDHLSRGRAQDRQPDVIIVGGDAGSPKGSGIFEAIQADPALAGVPILLIAPRGSPGLFARCVRDGVDDVIGAPLDSEELRVRVRALARLGRERRKRACADCMPGRDTPAVRFGRPAVHAAANEPMDRAGSRMMDDESRSNAPHVRCKAVVMFADLRGFTAMSERLDPPTVLQALNEFFPALVTVTRRHRGKVFGIAGDSLMTGFGVPVEESDAPLRAVRSAWDMLTQFDEMSERWNELFGVRVGLGVGIESGDVVAGYVGASGLESYTLVGDAVNTAARLTGRARAGEFLASASVLNAARLLGFEREALRLPPLELKGKSAPFDAWAVKIGSRKGWSLPAASAVN